MSTMSSLMSCGSDVELACMPSVRYSRRSDDADLLSMPSARPNQWSAIQSSSDDVEKQSRGASFFANRDVHSLAWHSLKVTVRDRESGYNKNILDGVCGVVQPGQTMALMGPSGSGKTTLLNTLARRSPPSQGQVLINGNECSLSTHRAVSSFVEQEDTLIGSLTVEETLLFAARLALSGVITKAEARIRASKMIDAFGLTRQARSIIGTPIQKGISGGQKRRVSVATQLVTGPRILYLDEPTSGLDSTASYEVMSFITKIARRNNLIVVASIHQPSTTTFKLFDKVLLLSRGKTCYYGSVADISSYLRGIELPIPQLTNPAEYMLDLTNSDFGSKEETRLDAIFDNWENSEHAQDLRGELNTLHSMQTGRLQLHGPAQRPSLYSQILTLIHRAWIKSYRDIVAYWIRVAMYLGLAIMMGTVWLRLSPTQEHIQPIINSIFFGSAFMSFMAVAYVPAFLEDRANFVKERANGLYGPTAFLVSNFLIGLPYLFLISVLFSLVSYWLINLRPTGGAFFTWVFWLFLDLLAAESLVVFMSTLFPNFVVSLALIAFANGLWMSVGGFLVPLPILNVFWKYVFHYIDYQAYVFQGMMVNEFKRRDYSCQRTGSVESQCHCSYQSALQDSCRIQGKAVLDAYGYELGREGQWVAIMVGIIAVYRLLGWGVTWCRKT